MVSGISNNFNVTNDVRQGGIVSPQLFNIKIDGLGDILMNFPQYVGLLVLANQP